MSRSRPLVFPQLDGLRGLAALDVLIHHFWPESTKWDITGGRLGVDIFFVLSGFLITRTLLRARERDDRSRMQSLREFFVRRIRRIVPVFYLTLGLSLLLPSERTEAFFWHLTFLSNIYFIHLGHFAGAGAHLWALAVEQHFYLFWPFVILWIPRGYLGTAAWSMIAVGLTFRALAGMLGWKDLTIDVMTPGVFEALGCGALLTFLLEGRETNPDRRGWRLSWLVIVGISLVLLRVFTHGTSYGTWFSLTTTEWSRSLLLAWLIGQCVLGIPGIVGKCLETNAARAGAVELRNLRQPQFYLRPIQSLERLMDLARTAQHPSAFSSRRHAGIFEVLLCLDRKTVDWSTTIKRQVNVRQE